MDTLFAPLVLRCTNSQGPSPAPIRLTIDDKILASAKRVPHMAVAKILMGLPNKAAHALLK